MRVGGCTDEQLGRPVPPRAHVLSQRHQLLNVLSCQLSGKAEITYLEYAIPRQKHVLRFEIPMHDVVAVHKVTRLEHLPDDFLRFERLNTRIVVSPLELVEDGAIQLLKDEKNPIIFPKNLQKVHDMIVLELLQNAYLSQRRLPDLSELRELD